MAAKEPAIYIQGDATDTLYLNPVPTPETSPIPPSDGVDPFGVIYVSSGDVLSPNVDHPYYRKPNDGQTYDLLQAAAIAQATFITVVSEPTLPQSRRLAVTSDMSLTDAGPLGPITIGLSTANSNFLAGARTASFVTTLHEVELPQSRQLQGVAGVVVVDNGAGTTVDVGLSGATTSLLNTLQFASFATVLPEAGLPQSRQIVAGAGVTITDGGAGTTLTFSIETTTSPAIVFTVTPVGITATPFVIQLWSFSKVGKQVTAIFDTNVSIDGGDLGISSVVAPAGSIPAGYRPANNIELVARFVGLTSLVFSSTWAIFADGSIIAAAVPTPISQFIAGPGRGWVACSFTWNTP